MEPPFVPEFKIDRKYRKELTVSQIASIHARLENEISKLLNDFYYETGVEIENIHLRSNRTNDDKPRYFTKVYLANPF